MRKYQILFLFMPCITPCSSSWEKPNQVPCQRREKERWSQQPWYRSPRTTGNHGRRFLCPWLIFFQLSRGYQGMPHGQWVPFHIWLTRWRLFSSFSDSHGHRELNHRNRWFIQIRKGWMMPLEEGRGEILCEMRRIQSDYYFCVFIWHLIGIL